MLIKFMKLCFTFQLFCAEKSSLMESFVLTLLSSCSSQLSLKAVRKGSSLDSAIREGLDSAL